MQKTPLLAPLRHSTTARTAELSGCYEASWGWVHVKPGCHCPRARY